MLCVQRVVPKVEAVRGLAAESIIQDLSRIPRISPVVTQWSLTD